MQPEGGSRPTPDNEAMWREYMTRGDPRERRVRRLLRAIPDGPRCAACAAPFGGLGGPLMRAADVADLEATSEPELLVLKGKTDPISAVRIRMSPTT